MAIRQPTLPKPALHHEVQRQRVLQWFDATSRSSVRIVCAPVGCGKTIAVKQYASRRPGATVYVSVPAGAGARFLHETLAVAKNGTEIVLDGVDKMEAAVYTGFVENICHGLIEAKLVLVGRSRRRMQVHALLARGVAAAYDPAALAFDTTEISALAKAFGVAHDDDSVAQALYDTEGWAVAAEWLIRDAAESGRALRDAFTHWRDKNGHLLLEFVENERYADDADAFESFRILLTSAPGEERLELERLEQVGLPLVRTRGGPRPFRILRRLAAASRGIPADRISRPLPPLMMLNVLGQFRCEIAGTPIVFSRRRDQSVFVFVALAPEGRATREAVMDAFWPGIDHRVAAQGLRTTLSRIRRAISEAAPGFDPELYFHTTGDLRLDWATIALDLRRFIELIEQGRLDDALGATESAKRHYRLAYCMYHDRLLASEAPEPCFERATKTLDALYLEALSRLTQLHAAFGELDTAREYAKEYMSASRGKDIATA
jgi:hypothetical protein